jgi:hypothetical protein
MGTTGWLMLVCFAAGLFTEWCIERVAHPSPMKTGQSRQISETVFENERPTTMPPTKRVVSEPAPESIRKVLGQP